LLLLLLLPLLRRRICCCHRRLEQQLGNWRWQSGDDTRRCLRSCSRWCCGIAARGRSDYWTQILLKKWWISLGEIAQNYFTNYPKFCWFILWPYTEANLNLAIFRFSYI
jgi:hypothetical protein